jgi:hypothetical protein
MFTPPGFFKFSDSDISFLEDFSEKIMLHRSRNAHWEELANITGAFCNH